MVFPVGARVRLNSGGRELFRKLTQHGGDSMRFTDNGKGLTAAEADGAFEVFGESVRQLTDTRIRSLVSGRDGELGRLSLRLERPQDRAPNSRQKRFQS
jgi:hypothetical protein